MPDMCIVVAATQQTHLHIIIFTPLHCLCVAEHYIKSLIPFFMPFVEKVGVPQPNGGLQDTFQRDTLPKSVRRKYEYARNRLTADPRSDVMCLYTNIANTAGMR
jgi:hypothetical protein